jgi:glycosyltransferase involved in cell wall biosynthesis
MKTAASPRVTVIIPTYNWSSVLRFAIASVLRQTMRDFELLVVGDGCTDDSADVAASFGDPRVRWINLPFNTGSQVEPNNRGLAEARGEFVAYLGHDDLWLPHHLDCLVKTLDSTAAAIAFSAFAQILDGNSTGFPGLPFAGVAVGSPPSCAMHRHNISEQLDGWRDDPDLFCSPVGDFWQRAKAKGFKFVFVRRLSVLRFPAMMRRNVYRDKPSHEQAAWTRRIVSDPDLEASLLIEMIMQGEGARALPARRLVPLVIGVLFERFLWRLSPRSGLKAMFWLARGGGVAAAKKYKGL